MIKEMKEKDLTKTLGLEPPDLRARLDLKKQSGSIHSNDPEAPDILKDKGEDLYTKPKVKGFMLKPIEFDANFRPTRIGFLWWTIWEKKEGKG